LTREGTEDHLRLASSAAARCFESAISLNPGEIDYRINLAIVYAEVPPAENPMKGIQSLLELNRQHPENTSVLYHLARFGMRTGQYDKAKERLEKALSIEPGEKRVNCLMAELLKETGEVEKAEQYERVCNEE
jgi:predicted Zn-dependent protease